VRSRFTIDASEERVLVVDHMPPGASVREAAPGLWRDVEREDRNVRLFEVGMLPAEPGTLREVVASNRGTFDTAGLNVEQHHVRRLQQYLMRLRRESRGLPASDAAEGGRRSSELARPLESADVRRFDTAEVEALISWAVATADGEPLSRVAPSWAPTWDEVDRAGELVLSIDGGPGLEHVELQALVQRDRLRIEAPRIARSSNHPGSVHDERIGSDGGPAASHVWAAVDLSGAPSSLQPGLAAAGLAALRAAVPMLLRPARLLATGAMPARLVALPPRPNTAVHG
jgi:hypothetical protein